MASRLLYRTLAGALREHRAALDFRHSWPARPGLRGVAAATHTVVGVGELEAVMLEFEELLQRPELQEPPVGKLLRPFFEGVPHGSALHGAIATYPELAERLLGKVDPIDQGFAALRLVSQYTEVITKVQSQVVEPNGLATPPERKPRPAHLLFACGDVCEHRFFGKCVVVGWDLSCEMGEGWIRSNKIRETLKFGTEQPFYHVLLADNDVPRYCSQENLALLDEGARFAHTHAPFYFRSDHPPGPFASPTAFVPSEALAFVYHEDAAHARGERNYRTLDDAHGEVDRGAGAEVKR